MSWDDLFSDDYVEPYDHPQPIVDEAAEVGFDDGVCWVMDDGFWLQYWQGTIYAHHPEAFEAYEANFHEAASK